MLTRLDRTRKPQSRYSRQARMSLLLLLSLVVNAALLIGVAMLYFGGRASERTGSSAAGSSSPTSNDPNPIGALGRVQPAGGVVNVFGPPGDILQKWLVTSASPAVKRGQQLAELSGTEERQLALDALNAQITEAEKLIESIETGAKAKKNDLMAELKAAEAKANTELATLKARERVVELQLQRAEQEFNRLVMVESASVPISEQEMLEAKTLFKQAQAEMASTREALELAKMQLEAAKAAGEAKLDLIEAETNRALAQVPLQSLKASQKSAQLKLQSAQLRAPVDGRIVQFMVREGDTLTTMPVAQIADTSQMVVIAEVYESDIPRLRNWLSRGKGSIPAIVDTRVLEVGTNGELQGTIRADDVGTIVAKNQVFALGPREDADRRVIEVRVQLDDAAAKVVANLIGLQVRVKINPPPS